MSCGKPHETPCSEVLDRVYWYLDGEVSEDDCDHIRQHLDECGPCLREYGLEEAVKRLVEKHTHETETPTGQSNDDESIGVAYIEGQLRLIAIRSDGTVRFLDPRSQIHNVLYVVSLELQGWKSLIEELEDMMN